MPEEKQTGAGEVQKEKEEDSATELASKIAAQQSAIYTTAFLVEIENPHLFRLTFAEGTVAERSKIRSAIVMPTDDVRELARILNSLLSKMDAEQTADKTESSAK
jgi:hypothetical protein